MTEWQKVERKVHNFANDGEFIGTFKGIVPSNFGGQDLLCVDEAGDEILIYGKTALISKFKSINPATKIKIVALGEKTSPKSTRKYQDFEVYMEK